LCPDARPELVCGDPGVRLLPALQLIKCNRQPGLAGSQGGLSVFECPDLINQAGTVLLRRATAQG